MNKKAFLALAISGALFGCVDSSKHSEPSPSVVMSQTMAQQLENIVEGYFDESMPFSPVSGTFVGQYQYNDQYSLPLTAENRKKISAFTQKYIAKLALIDESELSGQALLTYQIFHRDLMLAQEAEQFPSHLIPIDQMSGEHNTFAALGSGQSAQPFNTVEDYDNFVKRAHGFVVWLRSVEAAMREGISQQIVLPNVLAVKLLPQFQAHVVEDETQSVFWMPVANLPDSFTPAEKHQIKQTYRTLILDTLVPAYQQMSLFLENEYIPNARTSVGYSYLPGGKAWYEYKIQENTTLSLSADEIHSLGLKEVERILNEMIKVKEQVGFVGDLPAFFTHLRESEEFYFSSPQEVIAAYEAVKAKIDAKVPLLFDIAPKADYIVKAVEDFRAQSAAGASYQSPAPDGSRPGIFYINTHNLKAQPKFILETLSIHEAAPGHHFQIALQQEVDGLPRLRKFGGYTVFAEGWALYAESLGKEMGLFTDPYQWYGRLVDEQLRAMRLVLDTGLHAKGWTREQGIEFMKANSSMAESDIISEVERYIAIPGQALSYKLGQFKIRELREYSATELGEAFDVKQFHTQILIDGSLPMPILEAKIKRWVASQKI